MAGEPSAFAGARGDGRHSADRVFFNVILSPAARGVADLGGRVESSFPDRLRWCAGSALTGGKAGAAPDAGARPGLTS